MDQAPTISIIHEYQVLYSHRTTQRDKKWKDGYLLYYEFNHKIEIYNDSIQNYHLITTDFLHDQTTAEILHSVLVNDHEFRLPSQDFVVTVNHKNCVYSKDITRMFIRKKEKEKRNWNPMRDQRDDDVVVAVKSEFRDGDPGRDGSGVGTMMMPVFKPVGLQRPSKVAKKRGP
ncbi:uncharacterized protein LODBEIA_P24380 [Lodderomyces beijingensis]|uniref:5'-3' DNA helicase ZGRF1-like N-terminal domain-containing protein n=1 Tax=Lodderomyces beijingensis TaxID=1775926 RepID=A0ABP0ZJ94_9ASCO